MASIEGKDVRKLVIACDAGMGSSVLLANQLKKRLKSDDVTVVHSPVDAIPTDADVVLTQGLGLSSAQVVGRAMGLPDPEAALAGLPGDVVTLVSRAVARSVQVVPTSVEQWLLQAAARR